MKKVVLISVMLIIATFVVNAQSTKVLYFKADLTCCMAKSCNALQNDISSIIEENFDENVTFEVIKISDQANAKLVSKYDAKSQTVIIEKYKRNKLKKFIDVSQEVKKFAYNKDKVAFTKVLEEKIN